MGRRQLADRVADQQVGLKAPGLDQAEERDLGREQRRLGQLGAIQRFGLGGSLRGEEMRLQRDAEVAVHLLADRVEGIGIGREIDVEGAAHAGALGALAGEHEGALARGRGAADDAGVRLAAGQGVERLQQQLTVGADDHGATGQRRPAAGQRVADIDQIEIGIPAQMRRQAPGLRRQRLLTFGREQERHDGQRRSLRGTALARPVPLDRRLPLLRRLLQDHVGVGAADPEGRDAGAPRVAVTLPRGRLGQQLDRAGLPVDVGAGRVYM